MHMQETTRVLQKIWQCWLMGVPIAEIVLVIAVELRGLSPGDKDRSHYVTGPTRADLLELYKPLPLTADTSSPTKLPELMKTKYLCTLFTKWPELRKCWSA